MSIGAHRQQWILIDLEDYDCDFPILRLEGGFGAEIDILWAEALCEGASKPFIKKNRNEVEGKTFLGRGDSFIECRR